MPEAAIQSIDVSAYSIPTDAPESDGTIEWNATGLVVVKISGAGASGTGYSYADKSAAGIVKNSLEPVLLRRDVFDIPALWLSMLQAVRNIGRTGIASMAIAAADIALWDLKARLLQLPLVSLLGRVRERIPIYGSGGFTSYSEKTLCGQLAGWADSGIRMVKMKIGREPARDPERVRAVRDALPPGVELFVDANGAYMRRQARRMAEAFADSDVRWYEEPVSSDDLEGLRWLRDHCPPAMAIAAGEYGPDLHYFRRMLEAGAVDYLMPDVTRCAGISGYLEIAALARAFDTPVSSHCAPNLSVHVGCALSIQRHLEYFHDHARIEQRLFEGALRPNDGCLAPDLTRPGLGLEFKYQDAARHAV
ncbi:MAG TPA: enolase C-terminal domain-like protein [Gammaproteobacteria bacterium]|nr:enolase C-terminal domain-like protein [Gammaproteobacteria bacterium]